MQVVLQRWVGREGPWLERAHVGDTEGHGGGAGECRTVGTIGRMVQWVSGAVGGTRGVGGRGVELRPRSEGPFWEVNAVVKVPSGKVMRW